MFADRTDAGRRLAARLERWRDRHPLVLAIPKGGVEVGLEVARHLGAELSLLISRKLPFPGEPGAGFGAVAEDGSVYLLPGARMWLSEGEIDAIRAEQEREIERRVRALRGGAPLPEISGRTVILVDDGLAVGSTMRAALMLCRKRDADRVIVAVPVSGRESALAFSEIADDLVIVEMPPRFRAVAESYQKREDVSDEKVRGLLSGRRRGRSASVTP